MADEKQTPAARVYEVVARDANGDVASRGRLTADRLDKARRLFEAEGWTVEVNPVDETDQ